MSLNETDRQVLMFEVNKEELDSMIEPSHELIEAIGELLYNHQG